MPVAKNFLAPYSVITSGALSGALTSSVTDIRYLDNISVQLSASGNPTGTLNVQASLDKVSWVTFTSASLTAPDVVVFDLHDLSFPYIRTTYTRTGGSGTLDALVSGKQA